MGDITPLCGIAPEEKHQREDAAMKELVHLAGPCGSELYDLYKVRISSKHHNKAVQSLCVVTGIIIENQGKKLHNNINKSRHQTKAFSFTCYF